MEIEVKRLYKTKLSTIGELSINGVFECYTLEDVERKVKVASETAIPAGKYNVIINMSNRIKKLLPLLQDVPGFTGVRIHSGNSNHDTEGCILVGTTKGKDYIGNSRIAFNRLFKKMQQANNITIKIT